jgi:hypothetical protein
MTGSDDPMLRNDLAEVVEELTRELLGGGVEQPGTKLSELATDVHARVVVK